MVTNNQNKIQQQKGKGCSGWFRAHPEYPSNIPAIRILKSLENMLPVHFKQVLTYLRLTDKRLGLLINFGVPLMKDGIRRVVNGL